MTAPPEGDAYDRFVVCQIDMKGSASALEEQRSQGMDDIIAEHTESYEASR